MWLPHSETASLFQRQRNFELSCLETSENHNFSLLRKKIHLFSASHNLPLRKYCHICLTFAKQKHILTHELSWQSGQEEGTFDKTFLLCYKDVSLVGGRTDSFCRVWTSCCKAWIWKKQIVDEPPNKAAVPALRPRGLAMVTLSRQVTLFELGVGVVLITTTTTTTMMATMAVWLNQAAQVAKMRGLKNCEDVLNSSWNYRFCSRELTETEDCSEVAAQENQVTQRLTKYPFSFWCFLSFSILKFLKFGTVEKDWQGLRDKSTISHQKDLLCFSLEEMDSDARSSSCCWQLLPVVSFQFASLVVVTVWSFYSRQQDNTEECTQWQVHRNWCLPPSHRKACSLGIREWNQNVYRFLIDQWGHKDQLEELRSYLGLISLHNSL